MKKLYFLLAILFLSNGSFAQNKFYLAPYAGIGRSTVKRNYSDEDWVHHLTSHLKEKSIFTYRAGFFAGYNFDPIRIESGLQYSTSGYKFDNLAIFPQISPGGFRIIRFSHISVPLRVGYSAKITRQILFAYYIGLAISYNMGAVEISNTSGGETKKKRWTKDEFDFGNQRASLWWNTSSRLEFNCSRRLKLFTGPTIERTLSNFAKHPSGSGIISVYYPPQSNITYHFDFGAILRL
jgi:hypothetical protein